MPEQQIEVQEETTAVQEVPEQQVEVHDDHQLPQLPDDPDAVNISMTQEEMAVLLPQIEDIEMDLVKLVPDDEAMMITPVDYNLVLHEEEEMTITPVEDEKVKHWSDDYVSSIIGDLKLPKPKKLHTRKQKMPAHMMGWEAMEMFAKAHEEARKQQEEKEEYACKWERKREEKKLEAERKKEEQECKKIEHDEVKKRKDEEKRYHQEQKKTARERARERWEEDLMTQQQEAKRQKVVDTERKKLEQKARRWLMH